MSDLYSRYKVWYENAKMNLKQIKLDDTYLDACCFNTQQFLEFLLKHILDVHNINYPRTHDVRVLKDLLEDCGVKSIYLGYLM